ncbi:DUF3961 domain-containing protein [Bacillus cereus]
MTNTLFKIKSDESILTYPHHKQKPLKKICNSISENYEKINKHFGIEENISDQIWFYGFYTVSLSMLLFICIIDSVM